MNAQPQEPAAIRRAKPSTDMSSYPWWVRDAAIEALTDPQYDLSGRELKVAMKVGFGMPYNHFNREYTAWSIPERNLAELLGLDAANMRKSIRSLVEKKILLRESGSIALNFNVESWVASEVKTTSDEVTARRSKRPPTEVKTTSLRRSKRPPRRLKRPPRSLKTPIKLRVLRRTKT